ncbi:MAG: glycosyltransferase [Kofleriaceae bacterium]|jgi:glycosyltransferase involved in cell wall biosynthesis|nr:glycosyltransferase [Kofleriaceae bacterium]MBP6840445.1 glycosyltransferase [Kofleriaceae bacterium]MBP9204853.1 glycosyltransferase [Kofleriaceae bacterium]
MSAAEPSWSIVHVLSSLGVGGQERVALDLAAGQVERGHRVTVVSLHGGMQDALGPAFAAAGVTVRAVPRRDGLDPTLVARLAGVLRDLGAQIVHTHNPIPLIYGAPAARAIGAAVIHTKHGKNPSSRAQLLLRRAVGRLVHHFVAVSDSTAAQARELREYPADRIQVIANGIQVDRFRPDPVARAAIRRELDIPPAAFVVGTIGRVDEFKNQGMLVRALAADLGPDLHLVVVGDGPARTALEAAAADGPGREYIHVTGRRMDVDKLLPAFDLFALPSKSEGLPLVVPEAMTAGLPVVATSVGGLPDVVRRDTGILVPVEEAALREAILRLYQDRGEARAMGIRAREVALREYAASRMLEQYLALYAQARAGR